MSKAKVYIHVIEGHKVTEERYNKLSEEEKSLYDEISSLRKAKAAIPVDYFEEEE